METPQLGKPTGGVNAVMAETIRAELAVRGMSYADLAARTGISKETIYRRLRLIRPFQLTEIDQIAAGMGMETRTLISLAIARADAGATGSRDRHVDD